MAYAAMFIGGIVVFFFNMVLVRWVLSLTTSFPERWWHTPTWMAFGMFFACPVFFGSLAVSFAGLAFMFFGGPK